MTNIYVKSGTTGGQGTEAKPYAKIQQAINVAKAGDTIFVKNGVYVESPGISIRATAAAPLTIKAYPGHNPVVDGQAGKQGGINTGLPKAEYKKFNPKTGAGKTYGNLVKINGARYVVWDGIDIQGSTGDGLAVFGGADQITIKNCTSRLNRSRGFLLQGATNVTVDNCVWHDNSIFYPELRASSQETDWSEGLAIGACDTVTVKNCLGYHNWGEVYISDVNQGKSANVTCENNVFYDNMKGPYMHALNGGVFRNNIVYRTDKEKKNRHYALGSHGVSINAFENNRNSIPTHDIHVYNNLFINMAVGIKISGSEGKPLQEGTRLYHNTIVDCGVGMNLGAAEKKNMHCQNNIVYNCPTPASDRTTNNTRVASDWTLGYNLWNKNPGTNFYKAATDVINANPVFVNAGRAITDGSVRFEDYMLDSGSPAIGIGNNVTAYVSDDALGNSRPASPSAGMHEYDAGAPTAHTVTIAASPTSGPEPLDVDFTGTAVSGGTGPFTYLWDFGDGSSGTTLAPSSHVYQSKGVYTAKIEVTDTATGYVAIDEVTINVEVQDSTGDVIQFERVQINAGDTSYSVSGTPDAIFMVYGNGATNDTLVDDSVMGFGIFANENGTLNQYAMCVRGNHGLSGTDTELVIRDGHVAYFLSENDASSYSATITGVTSSTVSLSWSGTTGTEVIETINIYGSGVSGSKIITPELKLTGDVTPTFAGDWGFMVAPQIARGINSHVGISQFSLGFAAREAGMGHVGYSNRGGGQTTTQVTGIIADTEVGRLPREGDAFVPYEWNSTGVSFEALEDMNQVIPILMVGTSTSAQGITVSIEDTSTAVGSVDYQSTGYTPQIAFGVATRMLAKNTKFSDDTTGSVSYFVTDGAGTQTIAISSLDGVVESVEKSLTDDDWFILNSIGTKAAVATPSLVSGSYRLNYSSPSQAPTKFLLVTVAAAAGAGSGPNAYFEITSPTEFPIGYDEQITVQSGSQDDGVNAITSYSWDWGDGTSAGSGASATHTYTDPGEYDIVLTVTDAGAATSEYTRTIRVDLAQPDMVITATPRDADAGDDIAFDGTGSTEGGTETFDWSTAVWHFKNQNEPNLPVSMHIGTGTFTRSFSRPGEYDVSLFVEYDREYLFTSYSLEHPNYLFEEGFLTINPVTGDLKISIDSPVGAPLTATGSVPVTFRATAIGFDPQTHEQQWEFGDGGTLDQEWTGDPVVHTYSSVVSTTSYTVTLTVDLPSGPVSTAVTDMVTIVPAQTAPLTIPQLITEVEGLQTTLDNLMEHMGYIGSSEWARSSNYDHVYVATLNREWVNGLTITLIEDNAALSSQVSEAAVASNQGSFYASFSTPVLTLYVNTSDSDNPAVNGQQYRFKAVT